MSKSPRKLILVSLVAVILVLSYAMIKEWAPVIAEKTPPQEHRPASSAITSQPPKTQNEALSAKSGNAVDSSSRNENNNTINMPSIDKAIIDEITVSIVDATGQPVPNIGIYANPKSGMPLYKSAAYGVSAQDGIAVLQRIRTSFTLGETIELALCDRNQSNQAMQQSVVAIPDESTDIVTLIWNGELPAQYEAKSNNRLTMQLFTPDGLPICDAWFSISSSDSVEKRDGDMQNTERIPEGADLSLLDCDRSSNLDGTVVFTGLPKGEYSITVYLGKPPFSNVASTHPRLQQKFKMQRYKVEHTPEIYHTEALIFTNT